MHIKSRVALSTLVSVVMLIVLFLATLFFFLPNSTRAADEAVCAILARQGIPCTSDTMQQDNDLNTLSGGCGYDQYETLAKAYTPGTESAKEGTAGISKLDPDFACRLSKYISANAFGCKITIFSAYRSPQTQAKLFDAAVKKYGSVKAARKHVAPPPCSANTGAEACGTGSRHNSGLAADIHFDGSASPQTQSCLQVWYAAGQYKLAFPLSKGKPNGHEPWHIEPSGAVSGETQGSASAPTPPPASGIGDQLRCSLLGQCGQQQQSTAAAIACATSGGTWQLNQCVCPPGAPSLSGRCLMQQQPPQAPQAPQAPSGGAPSAGGGSTPQAPSGGSSVGTPIAPLPNAIQKCSNEPADAVCGKRTQCQDTTSSGSCTVGSEKTYLNRCFLNLEKATYLYAGPCNEDALGAIINQDTQPTTTEPQTTVTLVGGTSTSESIQNLGSQSTTLSPQTPPTATTSQSASTAIQSPVPEQTFSEETGSFSGTSESTFGDASGLQSILNGIQTILTRMQSLFTPMRYTLGIGGSQPTYDDVHFEDDIPLGE
jgi:hypothetical protein